MTHAALLLRLSPADLSVGTQGHHRPRKADVTTMSYSIDQLLPSLQSLGLWTYWVLALFAFLEATIVTGVIAPGGLVVIAGGVLAQRGYVDFFDMAWFVAAGAVIGSELSFYLGRVASNGLKRTTAYASSRHITRARGLLDTYGGFAIVIGRFFGPLSAFVPFSAAMAGMGQRKFRGWNLLSAVPYALVLPAVGYFSGHAIGILGAAAPRLIAVGATTLIVIFVLWLIIRRVFRSLPLLAEIGRSLTAGFGTGRLSAQGSINIPECRLLYQPALERGNFWASRQPCSSCYSYISRALGRNLSLISWGPVASYRPTPASPTFSTPCATLT